MCSSDLRIFLFPSHDIGGDLNKLIKELNQLPAWRVLSGKKTVDDRQKDTDRIRLIASCCLELYVIELPWRSVPADETEFVGITGIIDSVVLLAIVLSVGLGLF